MNAFGNGPKGPDGAPIRRAHLYVGNLSPRVTEYMLTEIFAVAGPVQHVKIIPDRNYQHGGLNYGFVEYMDMRAAETALQTLNGRKIFDTEIRVNWAYQGTQNKEDTTGHFHVFVGDLSPEVNDDVLAKAFSAFGTLSDARVMWDMNSGKSRGYGFLAFRDKTDAEQAIATMNGEWLGSRAIRVNWANQKTQGGGMGGAGGAPGPMPGALGVGMPLAIGPGPGLGMGGGMGGPVGMGGAVGMGGGGGMGGGVPMNMSPPLQGQAPRGLGTAPAPMNLMGGPLSFETVVAQTPTYNTTVYVGNLVPYTTQADLIPLFQGIGYLSEIRMQADRGFAFVKLDTHEHAALAIVQLQGQLVHGRPIKCSWGKDRGAGPDAAGPTSPAAAAAAVSPYGNMPLYGMPQPAQYGQYGFGAFSPAAPGAMSPGGAGAPPVAPGGPAFATQAQQPGPDLSMGQGPPSGAQWGADPNAPAFYNYWGGYYGQPGGPQAPDGPLSGGQ